MSPRAPHRFYYNGLLAGIDSQGPDAVIALSSEESHHLIRVLRIKEGERVDVFGALGQAWSAEVVGIGDGIARLRVITALEAEVSCGPVIFLAVSVLKRRAMDMMIEKLSELGVHTLQPLLTARSIGHQDIAPYVTVPERWARLALSASKQCGRNSPLCIEPPMPVLEWLDRNRPPALCACAHTGPQAESFGQWLSQGAGGTQPRLVAIGPEGGWTDKETEAFLKADFTLVQMGDLVMRAETAAMAAAAACRLI